MKILSYVLILVVLCTVNISCENNYLIEGYNTWYYTARFYSKDSKGYVGVIVPTGEWYGFGEIAAPWDSPWISPVYKLPKSYDDFILSIDISNSTDGFPCNVAIYVNGEKVAEAGNNYNVTVSYNLGDVYSFFDQ